MSADNARVSGAFAIHKMEPGRAIFTDGRTVWSYGEHFPIAKHIDESTVYVTATRHILGSYPSGKPKYGKTTDRHISAVKDALGNAGYAQVGTAEVEQWSNRDGLHPVEVWRRR